MPGGRSGRLGRAGRPAHAQGVRPRLSVRRARGRGGGSDPGDVCEGLPEPGPIPRQRRQLPHLADDGGAQPGHRPLPAAEGARGAHPARAPRPAYAARRPSRAADPLRPAGPALRRGGDDPPGAARHREEPDQPRPAGAGQAADAAAGRAGGERAVTPVFFDCARAEELLSDHLDGTLDPLLAREMEDHLRSCASCGALRDALAEVVDALRSSPAVEPSAGLAARVARAAILRAEQQRVARLTPRMPAWLQAVAAGLSVLTTAGILVVHGGTARAAGRLVERTTNAGTYVLEKKDRLPEDFRILRVVVG